MARRGGEAAAKRARERARQAKRKAKEEERRGRGDDASSLSESSEAALLEEFARLSAQHEAKLISHDDFVEERLRILTELGIENG